MELLEIFELEGLQEKAVPLHNGAKRRLEDRARAATGQNSCLMDGTRRPDESMEQEDMTAFDQAVRDRFPA